LERSCLELRCALVEGSKDRTEGCTRGQRRIYMCVSGTVFFSSNMLARDMQGHHHGCSALVPLLKSVFMMFGVG